MIEDLQRIMIDFETFILFEYLEINDYKINLSMINDFYTNRRVVSIKFLVPSKVKKELSDLIEYEFDTIKRKDYGIKVYVDICKYIYEGNRIIIISYDFHNKINFGTESLTGNYSETFIKDLKSLFKVKDLNKIETTRYIKNKY